MSNYIMFDSDFFKRKSDCVAKGLIGAVLYSRSNNKKYSILETESYNHDELDIHGKPICYGAGKLKKEAKRLVSAPLFDCPGTWCVYGGQLLLSATDDIHPDNVLIKRIQDEQGNEYGPDAMAKELHLYKSKPDYIKCHGEFSLSEGELQLISYENDPKYTVTKRVNICSDKKLNFKRK